MSTVDVTVLKNPLVPCERCGYMRIGAKAPLCRDCRSVLTAAERAEWGK